MSKQGGDVFKFVGDAMLVAWAAEETAVDMAQELSSLARRAAAACLAIQDELSNAQFSDKVKFNVKLGIGVGQLNVLHVGGVFNRLEYLLTGEALVQSFGSESQCKPGQVKKAATNSKLSRVSVCLCVSMCNLVPLATAPQIVVSPEVWRLISESVAGRVLESGRVVLERITQNHRTKRLQRTQLSAYLSAVPELLKAYVMLCVVTTGYPPGIP